MNWKNIITIITVGMTVLVSSCADYLDKQPNEDLTLDDVFAKREYVERFMAATYAHLSNELWFDFSYGRNPFVGASDEMEMSLADAFSQAMNSGSWSPANVLNARIWSTVWEGSRKVNLFLENIDVTPMDEKLKQEWIGEMKFLRAYFHFLGIRTHGPIPLARRSYGANEDFTTIVREPLADCIDFIVQECDESGALLPASRNSAEMGKPIAAAALALKSRILLYAASPLFNGNANYANYFDAQGRKLFPDYDANKWKEAADASLECIKAFEAAGGALYYAASGDPVDSYSELFLERYNKEIIFTSNLELSAASDCELRMTPNGMGGVSYYAPTQEIVDSYGMAGTNEYPFVLDENGDPRYNDDGNPVVNAASGYNDNLGNKFVGREPRFYASINYNGAEWRGRVLQFYSGGLDGKKTTGGYSKTGYLMRKMSSPNVNVVQGKYEVKTWIRFRLGEIYLNYAEALNEAGGNTPDPDVFKYVNLIRARAGMPNLPNTLNKDEMRIRIHIERKIELAFETHRYFDCHRWKTAAVIDNRPIHGLNIDVSGNDFFSRRVVEDRVFEAPKHYLFPIPQDDIARSQGALLQTPGW
ncbi:MAG: RagB/SusD family nutrient uptake outer membrane protein [Dysgonamonadaceae bacterium]|jgi:hypothetical protein|nr:RagB/SusD family nutrient uptake outer membrane protein [Dysgonamonadaceae bacterium]